MSRDIHKLRVTNLPQFVNVKTVAALKGVTPSTVHNWSADGLLTPVAILTTTNNRGQASYLYARETIERFKAPTRGAQLKNHNAVRKVAPEVHLVTRRMDRIESILERLLNSLGGPDASEPQAPEPVDPSIADA